MSHAYSPVGCASLPLVSEEEAVKHISSGERVFIHGAAMTPQRLPLALAERAGSLRNVELIHIHTEGPAPLTALRRPESFVANACFVGANMREALSEGSANYIPVFLSEIPILFRRGILPLDAAILQVSPPDRFGYCSLGASVDIALAAAHTAKKVIAEVNPRVPRTHGEGFIHVSRIAAAVAADQPLYESARSAPEEIERRIGKAVAGLVEDGATLQMGIGAIPDAVLAELANHRELGVHTEMFSDGLIDLIERGVVTNQHKKVCPGKTLVSFVMGSQRLYDFIDQNPIIEFRESAFTNDTTLIRKNPRATAINSAVEVDLTGQICAESVGSRLISGVGGQMDFTRGASLSDGGKPIFALPSCTRKGESKIVPVLKPGAGVTTTRAHVHYVVTEFGIANLYGKNLRQRARALIEIAHPQHREALERAARELFRVLPESQHC